MKRTTDGDHLRVIDLEDRPRVVLVGLGPVYAHGLSAGLAGAGLRASCATDPDAVVRQFSREVPRVLVVPQRQVAALHAVRRGLPASPVDVVHLVDTLSIDACSDAFSAGAAGVAAVDAELADVVDVVRAASAGTSLLPAGIARALCRPQDEPQPQLPPRELGWLRALAASTTVATLARASGVSEREMYRLLARLYRQLGTGGRMEALLLAERSGLLDRAPAPQPHPGGRTAPARPERARAPGPHPVA